MKYAQLTVGSMFMLGQIFRNGALRTLRWTKVDEEGHAVLAPGQLHFPFDWREDAGVVSGERAQFGWNYYPLSNAHQYLNARSATWYTSAHEGDMLYERYALRPGFLSHFTQDEIGALVMQEYASACPKGSVRQYGKSVVTRSLVTLPSASQWGCQPLTQEQEAEGGRIPLLRERGVFEGATRTGSMMDACHVYAVRWFQNMGREACVNADVQCPIILVRSDVPMSEDEDGRFVIDVISGIAERLQSEEFVSCLF